MTFLLAALGGVLIVLYRVRKARRLGQMTRSPLAGFDTGVRSPFRVPKGVRFHKGL